MRILAGILVLLLQTISLGQNAIETIPATVITGAQGATASADFITTDTPADKLKVEAAVKLVVKTDYKSYSVLAFRTEPFAIGKTLKQGENYFIVGSGKHIVVVNLYDNEKGILTLPPQEINVVGPEPLPGPKPNPNPSPLPDDRFDNLGKRVDGWAQGLPKRKQLSLVYSQAAKMVLEPNKDVVMVGDYIAVQRQAVLEADLVKYTTFIDNINDDLTKRWNNSGMSKSVLSEWFDTVARGLNNG